MFEYLRRGQDSDGGGRYRVEDGMTKRKSQGKSKKEKVSPGTYPSWLRGPQLSEVYEGVKLQSCKVVEL